MYGEKAMREGIKISHPLGKPGVLLRIEGVALLAGAVGAYFALGFRWWWLPVLLFTPDLAMAGYLISARSGAALYNAAHLSALPAVLGAASLVLGWDAGLLVALVWLAHIGMDRALGFGLKYETAFKDTHLGRV